MTLKQYIGTRVRQLRKEKNLSQQLLSEKAEVGIDYISNLETKGSNIKVDTLEKIISALEIEVSDFFQVVDSTTNYNVLNELNKLPIKKREELEEIILLMIKTLQ
ncbi:MULTISPECIES: helix-turn-helix domain-containing protein [Streptococcus]|uniref:Helix-turn-helix transcriptional regulator n=1 Tax=Streptococcus suis TaxID=1307 RepID=A0A4T2H7L4_STRSU|nr:helix-turn-helix transcriptional regulator [Streptococcus suis]MBM0194788.1 helix-turn-helix transcriptional regulator [Streptococcus suis]MBM7313115.1 helix-turn-helix transcriptional regulator [Streptococcus suis]MBM7315960.1 helix-turn-helix transcriptional regulator [Streptococcus suis]MBY4633679.1 helix-turn-helix domain-containing protein [Streptococcus suis]MCK3923380.1 helix-turn-helix transcriptional regulator [Streptococcus suis]